MLYQFVYTLMWTIDDVFFSYRSVKIEVGDGSAPGHHSTPPVSELTDTSTRQPACPTAEPPTLQSPVFIVGGFRTGSTTLHRVLALDEER